MSADPVRAAKDLGKLNAFMFAHEGVSMEEALELVKKPRAGNGVFLFKRQRWVPDVASPTAKRARIETNAAGT